MRRAGAFLGALAFVAGVIAVVVLRMSSGALVSFSDCSQSDRKNSGDSTIRNE